MKSLIISILLAYPLVFTEAQLLLAYPLNTKAQDMENIFVKMPDDMIVQLEEAWRKDLVDLYKSGKTATLENTMQGQSTLLKLTGNYLLLRSTEYSSVELKLLPLVNNTNIICMIETVYAPVADSRVSFYTTEWQPLSSENLFTPVQEGWFWKDESEISHMGFIPVVAGLDVFLVKYSLDEDSTSLTAEYMTPQYLDEESRNEIKPLLRTESKVYQWTLGRFE